MNKARTATILFYVLCILYVLSTATFVIDLLTFILEVSSNNPICKNNVFISCAAVAAWVAN